MQQHLFKAFDLVDSKFGANKKVRMTNNTGLGLSFSRRIAEALGGSIQLKVSERGLTSIIFKIPVQAKGPK